MQPFAVVHLYLTLFLFPLVSSFYVYFACISLTFTIACYFDFICTLDLLSYASWRSSFSLSRRDVTVKYRTSWFFL